MLTHGSNPKATEFTLEELQAAVEEAHAFGLRVEAHAHSTQGIKNAIRAGVASVEHATLIDDEGIALAKQQGTYLDMDLNYAECPQEKGEQVTIPPDFLSALRSTNCRNGIRAVDFYSRLRNSRFPFSSSRVSRR